MGSLLIGWKVPALTSTVASVRYRALMPLLALEALQVRSRLFSSGLESNLDGLDALVIVKSFTSDDLFLAQEAASRGIRVIFDLCDNIFIDAYGSRGGRTSPVQYLDAIAAHVDAIVVTTEPLAAVVRQRFPNVWVEVISDGIENPALLKAMGKVLREAIQFERSLRWQILRRKMLNLRHRLKEEGPGLLFRVAGWLIRRIPRALLSRGRRFYKAKAGNGLAFLRGGKKTNRPVAPNPAAQTPSAQVILWFGNHGAAHAQFGMLDLLQIQADLEEAAHQFDVELVVVSNHREKYEQHIQPLAIRSRYVEWSPQAVNQWLDKAAVVVIPNSLDAFSICKSANRSVLAVSRGVPVVATSTPVLDALAPYIHTGETRAGLHRYLADRELGRRDARGAYALALAAFGQEALSKAWLTLFSRPPVARGQVDETQCIVVLHLIQDLDLVLPVLAAWRARGVKVQAWCSASLIRKSPRVLATLEHRGILYRVLPDDPAGGRLAFPQAAKILLTASETNLGPHRFSRKLSELALSRGLTVATMQHGYENVGLTYEDDVHPLDRVSIKAQRIYIWGDVDTLHPRLAADVRKRCIAVGCTKPAVVEPAEVTHLLRTDQPVVGIFENLHWHRYSDRYKEGFLEAVSQMAERFSDVTFLVKPHHAGMWLTHRHQGDRPVAPNLVIADPQDPQWERYTASALLGHMTAVITSPSTVALDAARLGLPVAVFAGDLTLPNYEPLPLLRKAEDCAAFVQGVLAPTQRIALARCASDFVARAILEGDGAQRIVADLESALEDNKPSYV